MLAAHWKQSNLFASHDWRLPGAQGSENIEVTPAETAYRAGCGSLIIKVFPGMRQAPPSGCAATEIANGHGRGGNTEDFASPVSIFVCRRHRRNGTPEIHRGAEKCDGQRGLFSGTFSWRAGDAGRADYRIDGANRRFAVVAGSSRPREEAVVFCGRGRRAISPAGCPGGSVAS